MRKFTLALLLSTLSGLAFAAPAQAQDEAPVAGPVDEEAEEEEDPGRSVIVTGTRRTDRTLADSPVPVDVIGETAIENSGFTETNKILNSLVPSFNFPQPSIADGTDALRPASLRGLSPDQTLVLVNGKRRHVSALLNINGTVGRGSAAVDLTSSPPGDHRVEVLRDGASSQYGSDAIAGVINIQLRSDDNGGRAVATYGRYETSLEGVARITGLQNNAGQPVLDPTDTRVFAANSDGERSASDGRLWTVGANFGFPIGEGFVNLTAEYRDRNPTNRAGYDLRPNYNRPTAAFDTRELSFDRLQFRYGDARSDDYAFFINAGVPFGGGWEFYGFGSYGRRDGLSAANYRNQNAAGEPRFSARSAGQSPNAVNFVP